MPNRIIKESICTSDSVDGLSWFEETFFYRLIVNCDDYGRIDARPAILRSRLFPLKSITDKQIEGALQSLRTAGMIDLYVVDGRSFLQLRTWEKHQSVRAKKSKYPSPDDGVLISDNDCMQMISDASKCPRNPIQSESNPIRESNARNNARADKPHATRFIPPTLEEVTAYCLERGSLVNPQDFIDFYASKGWMVGDKKMVDWRAACRRAEKWESNAKPTGGINALPSMQIDPNRAKADLDRLDRLLEGMNDGH